MEKKKSGRQQGKPCGESCEPEPDTEPVDTIARPTAKSSSGRSRGSGKRGGDGRSGKTNTADDEAEFQPKGNREGGARDSSGRGGSGRDSGGRDGSGRDREEGEGRERWKQAGNAGGNANRGNRKTKDTGGKGGRGNDDERGGRDWNYGEKGRDKRGGDRHGDRDAYGSGYGGDYEWGKGGGGYGGYDWGNGDRDGGYGGHGGRRKGGYGYDGDEDYGYGGGRGGYGGYGDSYESSRGGNRNGYGSGYRDGPGSGYHGYEGARGGGRSFQGDDYDHYIDSRGSSGDRRDGESFRWRTDAPLFQPQGCGYPPYADYERSLDFWGAPHHPPWLSSAPPPAPPPVTKLWTEYAIEDGTPYYYNSKTGLTQWERPAELDQPTLAPAREQPQKPTAVFTGELLRVGELNIDSGNNRRNPTTGVSSVSDMFGCCGGSGRGGGGGSHSNSGGRGSSIVSGIAGGNGLGARGGDKESGRRETIDLPSFAGNANSSRLFGSMGNRDWESGRDGGRDREDVGDDRSAAPARDKPERGDRGLDRSGGGGDNNRPPRNRRKCRQDNDGKKDASEFGPPGCNLFVFHLPDDWTDDDLHEYFTPHGSVVSAKVMKELGTGRSRGFGFVSYENRMGAATAIKKMQGYKILGKRLKVEFKKGEADGGKEADDKFGCDFEDDDLGGMKKTYPDDERLIGYLRAISAKNVVQSLRQSENNTQSNDASNDLKLDPEGSSFLLS